VGVGQPAARRAGCEAAGRAGLSGTGRITRGGAQAEQSGAAEGGGRAARGGAACARCGRSSAAGHGPPLPAASPALAYGGAPDGVQGSRQVFGARCKHMFHVFKMFQKNVASVLCRYCKIDLDVTMLHILHKHVASA
jgi:hypothetical protein